MTKQKRLQIGLMIHHLENEYATINEHPNTVFVKMHKSG